MESLSDAMHDRKRFGVGGDRQFAEDVQGKLDEVEGEGELGSLLEDGKLPLRQCVLIRVFKVIFLTLGL